MEENNTITNETQGHSLESMVSSLQEVHLAQQNTLAELDSEIASLEITEKSAKREMEVAAKQQSILHKERLCVIKDTEMIQGEIQKKLERGHLLIEKKNSLLSKTSDLEGKLEKVQTLLKSRESAAEAYRERLRRHNSQYVSEEKISEVEKDIAYSEQLLAGLEKQLESVVENISKSTCELERLEKEGALLRSKEAELSSNLRFEKRKALKMYSHSVSRNGS